jgi:hypothetical protein
MVVRNKPNAKTASTAIDANRLSRIVLLGARCNGCMGKRTIDCLTRDREAYRSRSPADVLFLPSSAWNLLD